MSAGLAVALASNLRPLSDLLLALVPPLRSFRVPTRALFPALLCCPCWASRSSWPRRAPTAGGLFCGLFWSGSAWPSCSSSPRRPCGRSWPGASAVALVVTMRGAPTVDAVPPAPGAGPRGRVAGSVPREAAAVSRRGVAPDRGPRARRRRETARAARGGAPRPGQLFPSRRNFWRRRLWPRGASERTWPSPPASPASTATPSRSAGSWPSCAPSVASPTRRTRCSCASARSTRRRGCSSSSTTSASPWQERKRTGRSPRYASGARPREQRGSRPRSSSIPICGRRRAPFWPGATRRMRRRAGSCGWCATTPRPWACRPPWPLRAGKRPCWASMVRAAASRFGCGQRRTAIWWSP